MTNYTSWDRYILLQETEEPSVILVRYGIGREQAREEKENRHQFLGCFLLADKPGDLSHMR